MRELGLKGAIAWLESQGRALRVKQRDAESVLAACLANSSNRVARISDGESQRRALASRSFTSRLISRAALRIRSSRLVQLSVLLAGLIQRFDLPMHRRFSLSVTQRSVVRAVNQAILDNSRAFDSESAVRPIISSSLSMRGCAQFRYSSIRIVKRHVGILLLEGAKRYGGSS